MKRKSLLFLLLMAMFAPLAMNAQQALPYSYGFENNNLATDGWTTQNPSGLNASEFGIIGTAAQNGSYGFRFSSYNDRGESTQYLISPELVAPNGVVVQFYYKASSSYTDGETFQVGYSTTDDNISSFTFGSENNATNTSWEQTEELVFPAGTKYVAVYYSANYQYRLYVDDFSFEENLPCAKPENLSVTTDGQTATVTWDGTASNNFIVTVNGTPASGQTSPYTFNVALSTTYNISVTANCGSDGLSSPESISFTTPDCIGGHTINYTLNDSYGDGWNGNAIQIFDGCGDLVETLTIASGSTNSGTLVLCGDYYQFVWHKGDFASETSFTLTDNGTALYSNQAGSSLTDGQVLYTIGIQPPVMPTALTAGTPGADQVQLSWTENGTATTWQICINDDENNLVVANSNPFTLTGLDAVTPYTVKIRSTDGTNVSCWSNVVSFTTDSYCPAPTNLTATNLMPTSATLNWEGEAESYNVRYGVNASPTETLYDFENGMGNWTTIDADGDGFNWVLGSAAEVYTYEGNLAGNGYNNSNDLIVSGSYRNTSDESGTPLTPDNYVVSPMITLGGTISFYAHGSNSSYVSEHFGVFVSTNSNNDPDDFVLVDEWTATTTDFTQYSADLSAYSGNGYVAIRHFNCTDMFLLSVDNITITGPATNVVWTNVQNVTSPTTITGLSAETTYLVQVQANCGSENGLSEWSAIATFTTPDACAVPTDLTAEVTGNAANLSWTGAQENYNVHYREVDPTVHATIILNVPTDIWNDGSGYQMLLDADATAYGDVFTATGGWSATDYSAFEYLIPTEAECSADATHFVFENSVSIQIPAGTYDWCIVNPSPGDKIYIAAQNGNVGGRQDDYVFEPGMTYEFTPSIYGTNDGIDVTITDNNTWTLVEGVNNPYTLENLSAQTTYKYQVQGVDCDGNGGTTDWSASATFTTPEFYTKHIQAYSAENDGWYFIASPVTATVTPSVNNGFLANNYDLYYFDQDGDSEGKEWINHKTGSFNIENGKGYLYANSQDVDLVFTGAAYSGNGEVSLTYSTTNTDAKMHGWNLVGNPFNQTAYIDMPFYTLDGGSEYDEKAAGDAIDAKQGVLVHTDAATTLTFSTTPLRKSSRLTLNLTKDRSIMDRAIVCFNESKPLPKMQLRDNSTKVYIPMNGKDYAVVSAEESMGEMPVNFKAEQNGTYTLSFNAEEVSFGYLHLIDNMNGNDVDLLANPSYTFDAKTTDYKSRFKLVFATGSSTSSDTFAFFSNGSFVINNEGNATLQVIDANGRIITSESINGCANVNLNAAAGVYMLRLLNGDIEKTQKVVVR